MLIFYNNFIQNKELTLKITIFSIIQNLLNCSLYFLSLCNEKLHDEKILIEPFAYGLLLEEETHNLDRDEIQKINLKLISKVKKYET